jgi:hypothetical protein
MKTDRDIMRSEILLLLLSFVIAVVPAASQNAAPAQSVKVAFVKEGEVCVADADGTNVRVLTHGASADSPVVWSADGEKILYREGSERPNVPLALVVLTAKDGKEVSRIPIRKMGPDGTEFRNDMQFIEDIGWRSNTVIYYVPGFAHRHDKWLEMFDIRDGNVVGHYSPIDYSACPEKNHFAQVDRKSNNVQVDDKDVYFGNENDGIWPVVWNFDCTQLGFVVRGPGWWAAKPEDTDELKVQVVIVRIDSGDRTVIQESYSSNLNAAGNTFILIQDDGAVMQYDPTTRTFVPASKDIQERLAAKDKIQEKFFPLNVSNIAVWRNTQ